MLGAVIAATAGTFGVMLQQRHDDARLTAGEAVRAKGAARILGTELVRSAAQLRALRENNRLRPLDQPLTVKLANEDYVLVAGKLSGSEWGSVSLALSVLAEMKEYVAGQAVEEFGRELTAEERCALSIDIGIVTVAAYNLSALTGGRRQSPVAIPRCGPAIPKVS